MICYSSLTTQRRPDALGGSTIAFGRFCFRTAASSARIRWSTFLLLLLMGCAPRRAQAQFIGYTGPQTVQQTLATNASCTGGLQNFTVNNLGQIFHSAQVISASGTARFHMVFQGSADGVNFTNISDNFTGLLNIGGPAGISANGYFPVVRVQIQCLPVAANIFTLVYTGIAGGSNPPAGAFAQMAQDKTLFFGQSDTSSSASDILSTPFGNSSGVLVFNPGGATVGTGASLSLNCQSFQSINTYAQNFSLSPIAVTTQVFVVPATPCAQYSVGFNAGAGGGGTFTLEYLFTVPATTNSPFMFYSPAMLGVNALTEPAAGTSALSNIIEMRGAKQATLSFSCTAGAITLNVQEYAEDGSTALALVSPLSAVAAATNTQITFGSESNPSSNTGTLSTTALVRLPQRALAFSFTNAGGGAGTCTGRLFLAY